jgi:hypothetical protein
VIRAHLNVGLSHSGHPSCRRHLRGKRRAAGVETFSADDGGFRAHVAGERPASFRPAVAAALVLLARLCPDAPSADQERSNRTLTRGPVTWCLSAPMAESATLRYAAASCSPAEVPIGPETV